MARSPFTVENTGAPVRRRRFIYALRPPEWLVGLLGDVAPGQTDVVQVALGPVRQLVALVEAVAQEMQDLSDRAQEYPMRNYILSLATTVALGAAAPAMAYDSGGLLSRRRLG